MFQRRATLRRPPKKVTAIKPPPDELAARLMAVSDQVLALDDQPRLEDVAAMVGASRATLYYYFAGREDLVAFLLAAHVEEGAAAVRDADDRDRPPEERLRRVLAAMVGYLGDRPEVCASLLGAATARGSLAEVLVLNDRAVAAPLRGLLADGVAADRFALPDIAIAADALLGGILLGVLGRGHTSGGVPLDEATRTALVDQLTRGVLAG